jgi:amino acid transporter
LYIFFPGENITADYLLKIPLLSFCSVLPALIIFSKKDPSRREFIIRRILHFVFTVLVVVGLLLLFGWLDVKQLPFFVAFFMLVFCITTYIGFRGENKLADKINEKIKNQK